MTQFDKKKRKKLMTKPVESFKINAKDDVSKILSRMGETAFQGKNFGRAADCWEQMVRTPKTTIFMGLAGVFSTTNPIIHKSFSSEYLMMSSRYLTSFIQDKKAYLLLNSGRKQNRDIPALPDLPQIIYWLNSLIDCWQLNSRMMTIFKIQV